MDKNRLGKQIKRLRKSKKLTQVDLASGICHQSEISRIEKGEVLPSIDLLHHFSYKLKTPVSYFFDVLIFDDVERKETFYKSIMELSKRKKYTEIQKEVELELSKKEEHPEFRQFLYWQYWTTSYLLGRVSLNTCITELQLLLKKNTTGTHVFLDLLIKNSLANFYGESKNYKKGEELYQEILSSDINSVGIINLKIKVLYNYGKLLYITGKYQESLLHVEEGIRKSINIYSMDLIGQLYYQKGECLEKLGHSHHEISKIYQKAAFFFELLNMDYYREIIETKKLAFLK